ncbi:hypothetical protein ACWEKR_06020 [Nocardia sp. NPDC004573]
MNDQGATDDARLAPTDSSRKFGAFRFAGGRYETPGLPVFAMAELQRYAKLVGAVAHALYLEHNPDRKRVPQGFAEALDLRLTSVEMGSVVPVLHWSAPEIADHTVLDAHEEARALIDETFDELGASGQIPKEFPTKALGLLAQFGRSLRDDERIELGFRQTRRVIVNGRVRNRLAEVANFDTIDVERVLIGRITGIESAPHSFHLMLAGPDRKRMEGGFVDPDTFASLDEFVGYARDAPLCALTVLAGQRPSGDLIITDVLNIETALPPDWAARVAELSEIREGWLEPQTPGPSVEVIDFLELLLAQCVDHSVTRPLMFPSGEGGIQLEWRSDTSSVEVEIYNTRTVDVAWFQLEGDAGEERSFIFSDLDNIVEFIVGKLHD